MHGWLAVFCRCEGKAFEEVAKATGRQPGTIAVLADQAREIARLKDESKLAQRISEALAD